jgi:ribosomal protein L29
MAKKQDYKEKNKEELLQLLSEKREELRTLRFAAAGARPKDSNEPSKVRREIARIMTALHAVSDTAAA